MARESATRTGSDEQVDPDVLFFARRINRNQPIPACVSRVGAVQEGYGITARYAAMMYDRSPHLARVLFQEFDTESR